MDLRFWNYVIPDGSTTVLAMTGLWVRFWNYVIPDGSTTNQVQRFRHGLFWNYVIPDGSTTDTAILRYSMSFGTM